MYSFVIIASLLCVKWSHRSYVIQTKDKYGVSHAYSLAWNCYFLGNLSRKKTGFNVLILFTNSVHPTITIIPNYLHICNIIWRELTNNNMSIFIMQLLTTLQTNSIKDIMGFDKKTYHNGKYKDSVCRLKSTKIKMILNWYDWLVLLHENFVKPYYFI